MTRLVTMLLYRITLLHPQPPPSPPTPPLPPPRTTSPASQPTPFFSSLANLPLTPPAPPPLPYPFHTPIHFIAWLSDVYLPLAPLNSGDSKWEVDKHLADLSEFRRPAPNQKGEFDHWDLQTTGPQRNRFLCHWGCGWRAGVGVGVGGGGGLKKPCRHRPCPRRLC